MNAPLSSPKPAIRQVGGPSPRKIDLIVIHCSGTPSGKPLRQGKPGEPGYLNAPKVIDAWHAARGFIRDAASVARNPLGLRAIGYHYIIDLDGTVWAGRDLDEVGAHAAGFNNHSVGVCLIGGAEEKARYTPEQWKSLREVVAMVCVEHGVPLASVYRPSGVKLPVGVCGHRDLSPDTDGSGRAEAHEWLKTCPGFSVDEWIGNELEPLPEHVFELTDGTNA